MKRLLLSLYLLLGGQLAAQDKIYLLDGQRLDGIVKEISLEKITYHDDSGLQKINVNLVLLIEFSNGRTQLFNLSNRDIYKPYTVHPERTREKNRLNWQNEFYINTLSLYNADLSFYYEYRLSRKKIGVGLLGTYNFNQYATLPNAFIAVLNNAKKLFDAGGYVNFYTGSELSTQRFYYGLVLKYTAFNFTASNEDSIQYNNTVAVNISYENASGSQLSTLFNIGFHSDITNTMFFKSFFSMGFFILNGKYKEQLNYVLSDPQNGYFTNFTVLPKASLGICIGIKF